MMKVEDIESTAAGDPNLREIEMNVCGEWKSKGETWLRRLEEEEEH